MRDNLSCGVVEPAISKIKSLRFATEAAITILRIGECSLLAHAKREGGEEGRAKGRKDGQKKRKEGIKEGRQFFSEDGRLWVYFLVR